MKDSNSWSTLGKLGSNQKEISLQDIYAALPKDFMEIYYRVVVYYKKVESNGDVIDGYEISDTQYVIFRPEGSSFYLVDQEVEESYPLYDEEKNLTAECLIITTSKGQKKLPLVNESHPMAGKDVGNTESKRPALDTAKYYATGVYGEGSAEKTVQYTTYTYSTHPTYRSYHPYTYVYGQYNYNYNYNYLEYYAYQSVLNTTGVHPFIYYYPLNYYTRNPIVTYFFNPGYGGSNRYAYTSPEIFYYMYTHPTNVMVGIGKVYSVRIYQYPNIYSMYVSSGIAQYVYYYYVTNAYRMIKAHYSYNYNWHYYDPFKAYTISSYQLLLAEVTNYITCYYDYNSHLKTGVKTDTKTYGYYYQLASYLSEINGYYYRNYETGVAYSKYKYSYH